MLLTLNLNRFALKFVNILSNKTYLKSNKEHIQYIDTSSHTYTQKHTHTPSHQCTSQQADTKLLANLKLKQNNRSATHIKLPKKIQFGDVN